MAAPQNVLDDLQQVSDAIDALVVAQSTNTKAQQAAALAASDLQAIQSRLTADEQQFLVDFNSWIASNPPPQEVKDALQALVLHKARAGS